jgi:hypothetical protein
MRRFGSLGIALVALVAAAAAIAAIVHVTLEPGTVSPGG